MISACEYESLYPYCGTLALSAYASLFLWEASEDWLTAISKIIIDSGTNYDFFRTPFFRAILDKLDIRQLKVLALKIPSQIGKTLLCLCIGLEHICRHGGAVYYYVPTQHLGKQIFQTKLIPIVLNTPKFSDMLIRDLNGNPTKSTINRHDSKLLFRNGGSLEFISTGSKNATKGISAKLIICDELDECISQYPKAAGDFVSNLITRTTSYGPSVNCKILIASTPTRANYGIEKLWQESIQNVYDISCISCSASTELTFNKMSWNKPAMSKPIDWINGLKNETVKPYFKCPKCGYEHLEHLKQTLAYNGKWRVVPNENANPEYESFHLTGLFSERSWKDCVSVFLQASDNPEKMKEFRQQIEASVPDFALNAKITKYNIKYSEGLTRNNPERSTEIKIGIDVQTTHQELVISVLGKINNPSNEKQEWEIIDWNRVEYKDFQDAKNIINEYCSKIYGGIKVSGIAIDTAHESQALYSIISELNKIHGKDYIIGVRGRDYLINGVSFNRKPLEPGMKYNVLSIHEDKTNEELDFAILSGLILFPKDVDFKFIYELGNEVPVSINGKIEYKKRLSDSQNDYRDALRYCKVLFDYSSKNSSEMKKTLAYLRSTI